MAVNRVIKDVHVFPMEFANASLIECDDGLSGSLAKLVQLEKFAASQANFDPPAPADVKEIHVALEQSVRSAEECFNGMSDQKAMGKWRLTSRGKRDIRRAPSWGAPVDHAEPLVSSPWSAVGLPLSARRSGPGDLPPQRR